MAVERDGKFVEGGKEFDSMAQAEMFKQNVMGGGGRRSGGFEMGALGLIFKMIFLIIPMLLAKVFGWVMGLFLKLGIVGRVLLTATFSLIVATAMMILCMGTGLFSANDEGPFIIELIKLIGFAIIVLGPAGLSGIWFWRNNYPVIKDMPFSDFSKILTTGFAIGGYSAVGLVILFGYILKLGGEGSEFGFTFGFFLAIAAAIGYYLLKVKSYKGAGDIIAAAEADDADAKKALG